MHYPTDFSGKNFFSLEQNLKRHFPLASSRDNWARARAWERSAVMADAELALDLTDNKQEESGDSPTEEGEPEPQQTQENTNGVKT